MTEMENSESISYFDIKYNSYLISRTKPNSRHLTETGISR